MIKTLSDDTSSDTGTSIWSAIGTAVNNALTSSENIATNYYSTLETAALEKATIYKIALFGIIGLGAGIILYKIMSIKK
jgi:hypothetical protein